MAERLNWSTKEIYLATDLLWTNGKSLLGRRDERVISLSNLLRAQHSGNIDPSFRSPSSVARKIQNIYDKLPEQKSLASKSNGSKLEDDVIKAFLLSESKAKSQVASILQNFQKVAEENIEEDFLELI